MFLRCRCCKGERYCWIWRVTSIVGIPLKQYPFKILKWLHVVGGICISSEDAWFWQACYLCVLEHLLRSNFFFLGSRWRVSSSARCFLGAQLCDRPQFCFQGAPEKRGVWRSLLGEFLKLDSSNNLLQNPQVKVNYMKSRCEKNIVCVLCVCIVIKLITVVTELPEIAYFIDTGV